MTEKMIPGRRRFLQAFAALPLAGVVGGKMVAAEIAKAATGAVPPLNGPMPFYGSAIGQVASAMERPLDTLRMLIVERSALSDKIRQRHDDFSNGAFVNINALRSVSPAARNVFTGRIQIEMESRREGRWIDERIAELRKQVDPLDLVSLVDAA